MYSESPSVVMVHGVPESPGVWEPLRTALQALGTDSLVLSPPGFGAPSSTLHPATMDGYRAWLVAALEDRSASSGVPPWLVGHDWGGVHVLGVACTRPDLIAGWVSDAAGLLHRDYQWHHLAQTWQTAGVGEEAVEAMLAQSTQQRCHAFEQRGMPSSVSAAVSAAVDDSMGRSILALYRSAVQPALSRLGAQVANAAARPGLVVSPGEDRVTGSNSMRRDVAAAAGADVVELPGLGHWWLAEEPSLAAQTIHQFIS